MKKIELILIIILLITSRMLAEGVSEATVRTIAANWKAQITNLKSKSTEIDKVIPTVYRNIKTLYTVRFKAGGFVIVSADDNINPVLAYSDTDFAPDSLTNESVKYWLDKYNQQIYDVVTNKTTNQASKQEWTNILKNNTSKSSKGEVGPLLKTTWNQGCYYNTSCPSDATGPCGHVQTGCLATAMAQIMNYHKFPLHGWDSHSYSDPIYGTLSADFANTTYDWANMPDNLTNQNTAVATLMSHCGISIDMQYGPSVSWAYYDKATYSFVNYFCYTSATRIKKESYTDTDWEAIITRNIDNSLPIFYSGQDPTYGGHAFVCDGYTTDHYFHINWGWSGYYNGYFLFSALAPYQYNYSTDEGAIVNIIPHCYVKPVVIKSDNPPNICAGSSVVLFTDQSDNLSFQWKKNNVNISGATNSSYTAYIQGSYSVVVSDTLKCSAVSSPYIINSNDPVNATVKVNGSTSFCQGGSVIINVYTMYDVTYQWKKNGIDIANATTSLYSATESGDYTVFVKNSFGCTKTSQVVNVIVRKCSFTVSGKVMYNNSDSSLLSGIVVCLLDTENVQIASDTTALDGTYIFQNIINKYYKIVAASKSIWGGNDPGDALAINRFYIGSNNDMPPLNQAAADVNNDKSIDPGDALMINRRYIGVLDIFNINDWIFESPSITVYESDVIQNIQAICAGDVNGDYNPNAK